MSLTDLKKTKDGNQSKKKKDFTVDDFIADAENYAKGRPTLVSEGINRPAKLEEALAAAAQLENAEKKSKKPFRHATFTLSEDAIEQLQTLSKDTNLAKSHIIRILINELCNEEQQKMLSKLLASNVD
ncbi:hypothetical protein Q4489_03375 [Thalassotalea sp. 1_MG-2023]|uniref:hypothetical protein n=1 Tax=Thalassotalea sp. 1_MG-2023 TaxID=3062680 RepID=UPI0026E25A33|nr:hypothetical protein [Thalassotalea sp. 1_MG-2023]MDO6426035.1 hypothetical protein [Thalassotalea sp. 1_MG-2023]